jgi:peroxiredoxin
MAPRGKIISGLTLLLLVCVITHELNRLRTIAARRLQAGQFMPGFQLRDIKGRLLPRVFFSGKRYGLLFFRTDCAYCQRELSEINRFGAQYVEQLPLLAVSLNSAAETTRASQHWQLTLPVYLTTVEDSRGLYIQSVPLLILVDPSGRISYVQAGERDWTYQEMVFGRFLRGESLAEMDLRNTAQPAFRSSSNPCGQCAAPK